MGPGVTIGRAMTVVEAGDGLIVLNAVRLTEPGLAALDALGAVRHLVKLSDRTRSMNRSMPIAPSPQSGRSRALPWET